MATSGMGLDGCLWIYQGHKRIVPLSGKGSLSAKCMNVEKNCKEYFLFSRSSIESCQEIYILTESIYMIYRSGAGAVVFFS